MRILLLILIPILLLFVCALAMMWVPLPHPLPPPRSQGRNLVAAVVISVLGMGYLVGLVVYVVSSFRQAGRILDTVLVPAGLSSQSYLGSGQQYYGPIHGRQVEVYYLPVQGISRALLNVHVGADLGTRAAVGHQPPTLDCADCQTVDPDDPSLDQLHILAQDEVWMHSLLADPANRAALSRLLADQRSLGLREVYFQPDRIWLRARPRQISEAQFQQWLDDLLALAEAAESRAP